MSPEEEKTEKRKIRKFTRIKSHVIIDIYISRSGEPAGQACLLDVSLSGAGIETSVSMQENDFVRLNFTNPALKRISLDGKVLRRKEMPLNNYRYGIEFEKLSIIEKIKFRLFVKTIAEEE